jgi:uncharacterized protein DUF3311
VNGGPADLQSGVPVRIKSFSSGSAQDLIDIAGLPLGIFMKRPYWLLAIPVVLPLSVFAFNTESPRLGGFPLFYWLQLACVGLVVVITTVVYRLTKGR